MKDEEKNPDLLGEEYEENLYCIDCGQLLSRSDDKCFSCGSFQ